MANNLLPLFFRNAHDSTNSARSNSRPSLLGMRTSHLPLVVHAHFPLMMHISQPRQILQHDRSMLEYERIRRLNVLAPTIIITLPPSVFLYYEHRMSTTPQIHPMILNQQYAANGWNGMRGFVPTSSTIGSIDHPRLLPTQVDMREHATSNFTIEYHRERMEQAQGSSTSNSTTSMPYLSNLTNIQKEEERIHRVIPHQQYVANGSTQMGGFVPTTSRVGATGHQELLPTHVAMPKHDSGNTAIRDNCETLKRKERTTELALESSTNGSITAKLDCFDIANTHKEEEQLLMHKGEKNQNNVVKEIDFFPRSKIRRLHGNESEFYVSARSSSSDSGSNMALDLSLKL